MEEVLVEVQRNFPGVIIDRKHLNELVLDCEDDENGNIEYKRHIVKQDSLGINKLATQMLWRMKNSVSERDAIYYIGIDDNGSVAQQCENILSESLLSLVTIAGIIRGEISKITIITIKSGEKILEVHVSSALKMS